jgi:hypothetical protein
VSSAPDAPAPQGGGGRERARLDETTGRSKYAFGETYPTGDGTRSTADIIRALSQRESRIMRQIRDEISIVVKSRWNCKPAAQHSDEQRALQDAIDAHAEACRHRDEKRDALSATEQALLELDGFLKNAEADLEAEIAEAGDLIAEGEIALLSDRAAGHAERIAKLRSQIEFHVKLRDRLKSDFNQAALACKQAQDDLDRAKRTLAARR